MITCAQVERARRLHPANGSADQAGRFPGPVHLGGCLLLSLSAHTVTSEVLAKQSAQNCHVFLMLLLLVNRNTKGEVSYFKYLSNQPIV
jgi:hypothetical protein